MFSKKMGVVAGAIVALTMMLGAGAAYAGHQFTDVPNSSPWHANVDWLADRSITGGCGGGNYCPNAGVTRGQMAAFMERLGNVLTPKIHTKTGFEGAVAGEVVCQIAVPAVAYERQAQANSRVYAKQSGPGNSQLYYRNVYSTDGGTSWNDVTGAWFIPDGAVGGSGIYLSTTSGGAQAMNAGTSYLFGMNIQLASNVASGGCSNDLTVNNRQPGTVIGTSAAPAGGPSDGIN